MSGHGSARAADRESTSAPVPEHNSVHVTGGSSVRLHELRMRVQGESWIVGRIETGDFIALPPVGRRAMELLADGAVVDEVQARLRDESHTDLDIAAFVSELVALGFVAELDGHSLDGPPVQKPTFPWLRQHHVGWLLHPAVALAFGSIILLAAVALVRDPALLPGYSDLLWSDIGGVVILGNAAIGWTLLMLHELAHLGTARAAGVPGRISLGTRLQFLVMQTDVSGIWSAPRRVRLTVYLSGIAFNLVVFAVAILTLAIADPDGQLASLTAAVGLLSLLLIPFQFLVFMRTDVYFVLQDLAGCANLYADGAKYAQFQARRLIRRLRRAGRPPEDPIGQLRTREGRAVRAYTALLIVGTAACLAVAVLVTLPVVFALLTTAAETMVEGGSAAEVFDAVAVLSISGLGAVLWGWAWWRRHGHRVRHWLDRVPRSSEGR